MANLDTIIKDLVIANRILAKEDVVDAYGHISIRNPDNPKHFFLARSLAPELVERHDIVELGLDGQPVRDEKRALYLERFRGQVRRGGEGALHLRPLLVPWRHRLAYHVTLGQTSTV